MGKVLALMGSHRRGKNTNQALEAFISGLKDSGIEYEKLYLKDLDILDCTGCGYCARTGECIIDDDMQMVYDKLNESDGLVVAAPIYFNSVNGLTKSLIDRCQKYYNIKYEYGREKVYISDKVGYFIGIGGAPFTYNQFTYSVPVMDMFYRAVNGDFRGSYLISETDKSSVKDRPDIVEELRKIGSNFYDNKKFIIQKI